MSNGSSKSLGSDIVHLSSAKIITLCMTTITSMLLARFRTLEEYGTYSQLLLVINLVSSFFMLGLPSSINFFLSRCEINEDKQKFLSVYYTLSTLLSIIMGGTLVAGVPLIVSFFNNSSIYGFVFFLAIIPWTMVINSSLDNILVIFKRTKFLMIYRIIHSFCILLSVVYIQMLGLGFKEYMISYVIVEVLFSLCVYFIVYKLAGKIYFCFSKELIKKVLVFSLPLGFASIIGTLDIEIDKLLIGKLLSTEQLAIYSNASKELPLTIIASSITAVLLPKFSHYIGKGNDKLAVNIWKTSIELSFLFLGVMVTGIITYANEVIEILYSDKYLSGVSVFRIYTGILLLRTTYFGIILNAKGKTKAIMYCSLLALVVNVILNPLFFYIFGITGPALATGLSILAISILQLAFSSKYTDVPFSQIFPYKNCFILLIINVFMGIIFFYIKKIIRLDLYVGNIMESVILGIIWTILYFFVLRKRISILWNQLKVED